MPVVSQRKNKPGKFNYGPHRANSITGHTWQIQLRATPGKFKKTLFAIFEGQGFSRKLQSHMGTEFVNKVVDGVVQEVGISHRVSQQYRLQVLRATERRHKRIKRPIRIGCESTR
ncbi:hypothetical protein SARC_11104 [Sphaeroforma arctica JP610]|uniref:Integrase catalytic domain-containing protein n=1 Tax=Sphaeroforma arctica JP610 TaxID=667725 RepID=A0A0L0FK25_9EUKA|nr:hypothetical protein SARC_11104 [Sphaeroforma arctica JP610]KNC76398.1 hypothetical protein SARC_11104 [Sphaeroforma arctica JP610]|eukprot:XP_014150300.1 hypothetical protein SARC_11104 [Sphaeroforma arctica JP610]